VPAIYTDFFRWTVPIGVALFAILWLPTQSLARRSRIWRMMLSGVVALTVTPTALNMCGEETVFPAAVVACGLVSRDSLMRKLCFVYGALPIIALTAFVFCVWSYYAEKKQSRMPNRTSADKVL
jgi:hypothetical protein